MEDHKLNQAIQADLDTLKRLKVGIIPSSIFYKAIFQGVFIIFALFLIVQSMACYFVWGSTGRSHQDKSKVEQIVRVQQETERVQNLIHSMGARLQQFDPANTAKKSESLAKEKDLLEHQTRLHEEERNQKSAREQSVRVVKMVLGVFFSSLFFTLFFIGKVKNYVIFKFQLQDKLNSGGYIAEKITQVLTLYFGLFGIFSLIGFHFFDQDMTFFAGLSAFIFSGVITTLLIGMEMSRIGVSVLAQAVNGYFHKRRDTGVNIG